MGVTNPKAIIFFSAVLPQFVDVSRPAPATQMPVLGLLFCVLASGVDGRLMWDRAGYVPQQRWRR